MLYEVLPRELQYSCRTVCGGNRDCVGPAVRNTGIPSNRGYATCMWWQVPAVHYRRIPVLHIETVTIVSSSPPEVLHNLALISIDLRVPPPRANLLRMMS